MRTEAETVVRLCIEMAVGVEQRREGKMVE